MANNGQVSDWRCVNESCSTVLGRVIGGQLEISERITGDMMNLQGPNIVFHCPDCKTRKIWYTSDNLSRAIYSLIDAMTTEFAKKAISKINSPRFGE